MIPRWVYRSMDISNGTLHGYLDFTLSEFRVADSTNLTALAAKHHSNVTICQ